MTKSTYQRGENRSGVGRLLLPSRAIRPNLAKYAVPRLSNLGNVALVCSTITRNAVRCTHPKSDQQPVVERSSRLDVERRLLTQFGTQVRLQLLHCLLLTQSAGLLLLASSAEERGIVETKLEGAGLVTDLTLRCCGDLGRMLAVAFLDGLLGRIGLSSLRCC